MSASDKFSNKADDLAGKAKEGFSKATGDRGTENEGQGRSGQGQPQGRRREDQRRLQGLSAAVERHGPEPTPRTPPWSPTTSANCSVNSTIATMIPTHPAGS